jgi:uncharacterized membrane protein
METKPWWESRAQVGALVALGATLLRAFGLEFDEGQATDVILAATQLIALVLAIWGNMQRTKPLDKKQVLPGIRLR